MTTTTEGCVQKVPVRCDCGTEKAVRSDHLRKGRVVGCGKCRVLVHGYTGTRTYGAWRRMRRRCKPGGPESRWYSDRNIAVCERWEKSFKAFLQDMGECPEGLELDRIDGDKGYFRENCRWADRSAQTRNRRARKHTSRFKGVGWSKQRKKWRAYIAPNGTMVHLGFFANERDAALAYNVEAAKHPFYRLNDL